MNQSRWGWQHGYYLVSARPQAVMVHVNVGLANAVMGAINAASDNVLLLLMSGRTPQPRPAGRGTGDAHSIWSGNV